MSEQNDLREFVRALVEWTRASIDSGRFSEEEASDMRMHAVVLKGMTALILDQTAERDQAAECLHRLMGAVLYLGSRVMTSESAAAFLRAEHTAPSRNAKAVKHERDHEIMRQRIAELEKNHPPDRRGNKKRIADELGVNRKALSRLRKKII